jgi:NAD(P)-dependent dehydrogenase (short-subunit alcohol dehydrogenase family)
VGSSATSGFDLSGKVAVVTGGNTGIGLAFATALAEAGAAVSVWGRSADRNRDAVAALTRRGAEAASIEVDVTDEGAIVAAMVATRERFGHVDACFANAASQGPPSPSFIESTADEWRATLAIVLDSVYLTLREAARAMVEQGTGGSLVATSSVSAHYGTTPGSHAYSSGKAAVLTLVKGLAVELGRYGIRANAVSPAWVESDMMNGINANPKLAEAIRRRIPSRRFAATDELGAVAVYLAGDGSSWQTGDELVLDGGFRVT